jgi:hypothetical protein
MKVTDMPRMFIVMKVNNTGALVLELVIPCKDIITSIFEGGQ